MKRGLKDGMCRREPSRRRTVTTSTPMKRGLKGTKPGTRTLFIGRNNLYPDEKGTESMYERIPPPGRHFRNNLYPDEKGTESNYANIRPTHQLCVTTSTPMKRGLKA